MRTLHRFPALLAMVLVFALMPGCDSKPDKPPTPKIYNAPDTARKPTQAAEPREAAPSRGGY